MKMVNSAVSRIFLLLGIAFGLTGCGSSWLSIRQTNPSIEGYMGLWPFTQAIGTLAPDASRRVTVMRLRNGEDIARDHWMDGEFCAEPPPDAMANTASAFAVSLAEKLKMPAAEAAGASVEGENQQRLVQEIAAVMNPLYLRSNGVQWARDRMSDACHAFLNRRITKDQYFEWVIDITKRSDAMVTEEMEHFPVLKYEFSGAPIGSATVHPIPSEVFNK
jgi:hypothetical protein